MVILNYLMSDLMKQIQMLHYKCLIISYWSTYQFIIRINQSDLYFQ